MEDPRAALLLRHLPAGADIEEELALLAAQPAEKQQIVEERLEVIDQYLHTAEPTSTEADTAAAQIGIARRRFYRLLANIREFGPVRALSPGFRKNERSAPTKDGLAEPIETAIAEILARQPDAKMGTIEQFVREACERHDIDAPNKTALRRRVLAIKRTGFKLNEQNPFGARIFIDQIGIDLPIEGPQHTTFSVLTLIVDPGTRLILGGSVKASEYWGLGLAEAIFDSLKRMLQFAEQDILVADHMSELKWIVGPKMEYAAGALSPESLPKKRRPTIQIESTGIRRHGDAILRTVGDRLGAYNLRQSIDFSASLPKSDQRGVTSKDAALLISYAIDRWNEQVIEKLSGTGMYRPNRLRRLQRLNDDIANVFTPVVKLMLDRRGIAHRDQFVWH